MFPVMKTDAVITLSYTISFEVTPKLKKKSEKQLQKLRFIETNR